MPLNFYQTAATNQEMPRGGVYFSLNHFQRRSFISTYVKKKQLKHTGVKCPGAVKQQRKQLPALTHLPSTCNTAIMQ